MISLERLEAKEIEDDEDLQSVVSDLDAIFSRWIRWKDLDKEGFATCVTCGKKDIPQNMHNGHFIPRAHSYTRFSELNCACQCPDCNIRLRGNVTRYAEYIESIRPGGVELLMEQGHTVYKYSISELKSMISDYSQKLKQLK